MASPAPLASFSLASLYVNQYAKQKEEEIGIVVGHESGQKDPEGGGNFLLLDLVTGKNDLWPFQKKGAVLQREKDRENDDSVNKATATLSLFGCCFYNCCCCCFPTSCVGPWCGRKFWCNFCACFKIKMRRDRWLWLAHFLCFCIHSSFAYVSATYADGADMLVTLTRTKPDWQNRGGSYKFDVVDLQPEQQVFYIDTVTAMFFGFSAGMHGIWVFASPWEWSIKYLWEPLDNCFCYWRWLECKSSQFQLYTNLSSTN